MYFILSGMEASRRLKKRIAMSDIQIPLAAVGEWISAEARQEAATRKEVTVAIQKHTDGSVASGGGAGSGGKVDTLGLHFGCRVARTYQ